MRNQTAEQVTVAVESMEPDTMRPSGYHRIMVGVLVPRSARPQLHHIVIATSGVSWAEENGIVETDGLEVA